MFPGRFYLGLGAGEALNEHIIGDYWPEPLRGSSLAEADRDHQASSSPARSSSTSGKHFNVESAKLYTMPSHAAADLRGDLRTDQARAHRQDLRRHHHRRRGRREDQDADDRFEKGAREAGKDPATMPQIIQFHVSWAGRDEAAAEQAVKSGRTAACPSRRRISATPRTSRRWRSWSARRLQEPRADLRRPQRHLQQIQHYVDLGFNEVYVHNVGRNQERSSTPTGASDSADMGPEAAQRSTDRGGELGQPPPRDQRSRSPSKRVPRRCSWARTPAEAPLNSTTS